MQYRLPVNELNHNFVKRKSEENMPDIIKTKVRGVSQIEEFEEHSRQEIIKNLVTEEAFLSIEREHDNKYDPNAIAVWVDPEEDPWEMGYYKIGYLSKELAEKIAPKMDSGWNVDCNLLEKTGGGQGYALGVNIELQLFSPQELEQAKRRRTERSIPIEPLVIQQKIVKMPKVTFWRAFFGLLLLATYIILVPTSESLGFFLFITVVLLGPTYILIWPWIHSLVRWAVSKISRYRKTLKDIDNDVL